jgi:MinD-like ATPase involved in chromosome partitioning or flagellar assembly
VTIGLLTAGVGYPWETELVAALDGSGAPMTVVRRCADLADVLALASTGQARACVLSSDLRRLDSEAVQRLGSAGVAVVVVHPTGDGRAPTRLSRIGVPVTVADDAGTSKLIAAILGAIDEPGPGGSVRTAGDWTASTAPVAGPVEGTLGRDIDDDSSRKPARPGARDTETAAGSIGSADVGPAPGVADGSDSAEPGVRDSDTRLRPRRLARFHRAAAARVVSDPAAALASKPAGVLPLTVQPGSAVTAPNAGRTAGAERAPGRVIAVWGPVGAPGRSTVAMGIADEIAAAGKTIILIDADVYGGVLAAAYGLLDESPGLAGACRLAANGRLDSAALAGLCWSLSPELSLLTGIARADRWPEVRPSAIPMVLDVAKGLADVVVVDCAAILETDEEISFDTMAPRRNGATLAVLAGADTVLAVGAGDPPGIERLVRGLAQLSDAVPEVTPRVVVNRTRRTAASVAEINDALARFTGTAVAAHLPEDREATDKAWRRSVGLSTAAPRSTLRSGLVALAADLSSASSRAGSKT